MRIRSVSNMIASIGVLGGSIFYGTSAVGAATLPDSLSSSISYAQGQINARIAVLNILVNRLDDSTTIQASDKAALLGIIGNTSSGDISALSALSAKVGSESTVSGVRLDLRVVYSNYRIYAVVRPETDLVLIADQESHLFGALQTLEPDLQTIISSAGSQQAATVGYGSFVSNLADATSAVGSIASQALAITPTSFNQDPTVTHAMVANDWKSLGIARGHLVVARGDITAIIRTVG